MANLIADAKQQIIGAVAEAIKASIAAGVLPEGDIPTFTVEIPSDRSHGDFATNAAMVSARSFRQPPRKIAEAICANMSLENTYFTRAEIAGAGFINFFLDPIWYGQAISSVLDEKEQFGRSDFGAGKKVMVEFVSANPTGPMHIGNARGGGLGDCLASVLDAAGYDVTREFYVNDAGNQIEKFGKSLSVRYQQIYRGEDAVPFPEDGYHGQDIRDRAQQFADQYGDQYLEASEEDRAKALVEFALPQNIDQLRADLEKYRIVYDVWFKESTLHNSGKVREVIDILTEKGLTYEKEGALWYRSGDFSSKYGVSKEKDSDEVKDEVLVRANGHPTYFAADIAYHYNKFHDRGFDRVINIWGADHHGHVARLKGAMDAVGLDGEKLDIVLMQLVRLMKNGEVVRVSKRTGKSITLADLLEEVPLDAARFFFNLREPNSHLDFDLGLAVEQTSQNPVYYVQYAHARICSIFKNLAAEGISTDLSGLTAADLAAVLTADEERELIRHIASFTGEIIEASRAYDPARITRYSVDLATLFHKFYNACRVKGEDEALMKARLALCMAVRITLRNVLSLLKVESPESM